MITNNYTPYAGGVVRAIQTYTHELQRAGHTVYIITLDFGVSDDPPHVFRVPSCFRFYVRNNILSVPWRAYAYVRRVLQRIQPDVIHVHSPFVLGSTGLRAAREHRIPVVFTYHSLYERFVSYVPVLQSLCKQVVLNTVHTFCTQVNTVIVPSTYIKSRVSCVVPAHHVWHVPTPIARAFFQSSSNIERRCFRGYVISVGRFQPEKQMHDVIDAFASARRYVTTRLVLIGFGASYRYLRWYAYSYWGLSYDDVQFVYHPDQKELRAWYQSADVFISASPEAQGLVFAEACAYGVPIVALQSAGVEDIVTHAHNGFLADDISTMAAYIRAMYADVGQWRTMSRKAYEASYAYHPDVQTKHLINCYYQCMPQDRI